jgi:hypothetical protein
MIQMKLFNAWVKNIRLMQLYGAHTSAAQALIGNKDLRLALKRLWKSTLNQEPDSKRWDFDWRDLDILKTASEIGLTNASRPSADDTSKIEVNARYSGAPRAKNSAVEEAKRLVARGIRGQVRLGSCSYEPY